MRNKLLFFASGRQIPSGEQMASDLRRAAAALFADAPVMRAAGYLEQAESQHSAATRLLSEALRFTAAAAAAPAEKQDVA